MIIDRPTPATRNGLGNVIRGWPRWTFPNACKKHKLCSSWRVQKAYLVGISMSDADFCTCLIFITAPCNIACLSPLAWKHCRAASFPCSLSPWCRICNSVDWGFWETPILFVGNATPVPWRTGRTKVALVELPTVNMCQFFFWTPFPLRILAWSCVVPRSHFHPPNATKSYRFKRGW